MVNLPNDIYVICAYIGINVLLYLVRNIPGPRRAKQTPHSGAASTGQHTVVLFPNYGQDIIRFKVEMIKPTVVSIENR